MPNLKLSGITAWWKSRKRKSSQKHIPESAKKQPAVNEGNVQQTENIVVQKEVVKKENERRVFRVKSWYKKQQQKRKEKEEERRRLESPTLKLIAFVVTAIAMTLGMSILPLPLFPQPLPMLLALLIAIATYRIPRLGMAVGGIVIGLGLLYHLAEFRFISFLGDTTTRVVFIVVWMALFVGLPLLFNRYHSALAIDFGILSFVVLFSAPTYFLAIPLMIASAIFFKKYVTFTVIYYVLLTVPLQIMQYYTYVVLPIERTDWWVEAGSSPPIIVPLTLISKDLGASLAQFRLYDISNVFNEILGQTTWTPTWSGRPISAALSQYLDSVPGLVMFVMIVAGLALTFIFFTRFLIKERIIGRGDKFFPCFNATIAAALLFVLLGALQIPLAFTADINPLTMLLGIFGTLLLTLPTFFMDYNPNKHSTNQEIADKAKTLMDKQLLLETQLNYVKDNTPVNIASPASKSFMLKSSLQETLDKSSKRLYTLGELDQKFDELEALDKEIEAINQELNTVLSQYQIFASCEYSSWIGKLRTAGLDVKNPIGIELSKDVTIEQKVKSIKQILEAGTIVAKEFAARAEPIYGAIRLLYDPSLPAKSHSVEFALEKLAANAAPWGAMDALYNAINNWKRQYGADIQQSMRYLQKSLVPIASLSNLNDLLLPAFREKTPQLQEYVRTAELLKDSAQARAQKEELDILDVVNLDKDIGSFLEITNSVLSILQNEVIFEEETIERLLPTKDYLWEKNITLRERLEKATTELANPSGVKVSYILESAYRDLACIEEGVQTLAVYSERREFLLNYPLAIAAIEEALKQKRSLAAQDLPFQPKFAAEYLKLYYSQRFGEYTFDKENSTLTRNPSTGI